MGPTGLWAMGPLAPRPNITDFSESPDFHSFPTFPPTKKRIKISREKNASKSMLFLTRSQARPRLSYTSWLPIRQGFGASRLARTPRPSQVAMVVCPPLAVDRLYREPRRPRVDRSHPDQWAATAHWVPQSQFTIWPAPFGGGLQQFGLTLTSLVWVQC